jgi:hypothetical protein
MDMSAQKVGNEETAAIGEVAGSLVALSLRLQDQSMPGRLGQFMSGFNSNLHTKRSIASLGIAVK